MRIEGFQWDGRDAAALAGRVRGLQPAPAEVAADVAEILSEVEARGDEALLELEERFAGQRPRSIRVDSKLVDEAAHASPDLLPALNAAAESIRAVAEAEMDAESSTETQGKFGQRVSVRSLAVQSAGAYVPGGRAGYPSSALMSCIAARVAGVGRVAVATPAGPDGVPGRAVLAACAVAGADEVHALSGAQAIGALAVGTATIAPVDVIVGPGNNYVQEAKRQVYGRVGIDGIAGPSELMVVLDEDAGAPRWAALDLCAQAEHGGDGLLVLASPNRAVLDSVLGEIEKTLNDPALPAPADPPLAVIQTPGLDATIDLANALAPEHLELFTEEAATRAHQVRTAGCVFVGENGATAFGDYAAGSNHVLPTAGAGRFQGPLGPGTFRRRIATVEIPPEALEGLTLATDTLARAEGFPIHGASALARSPYPGKSP